MKLTKKLEAEILKLYHRYWDAYLMGKMWTMSSIMDKNIQVIRSGQGEIFNNKKETVKFYRARANQIAGKGDIRNRKISLAPAGNNIMVTEESDFFVLKATGWTLHGQGRISTLFAKSNGKWLIIQQHGSLPDARTSSGEQLKINKIKLTKQLEAEIKKFMKTYWDTYLKGDLKTWASFLPADYKNIGGTEEEIWNSKKEILDYSKRVINQLVGQAEIRNTKTQIFSYEPYIMVHEFMDMFIKVDKKWTFYGKFRLSSIIQEMASGWKVLHQHGSFPDSKAAKGEAFSVDQLKSENIKLLAAVKSRTAELEGKNRELEIETGLERVRAKTMAMHKTSELQSVIHTVHQELLKLNIGINGGSFITINADIDKELHCWGAGGTADTSEEVIIPYYNKPFYTNIVKRIKKGSGFFTEAYTQKEKKAFFSFLFKHEPWSKLKAKEKKETLASPGGYTRSCSVSKHTSIFIINHFGKIFSKEDNNILKRFGKVFEQSYTRFLDLQKAEAQTREAQIELGLERVRARAMAMQHSGELAEAAQLLYHEFGNLGINTFSCGYMFVDESKQTQTAWVVLPDGSLLPNFITFPLTGDQVLNIRYKGWKEKKPLHIFEIQGKENKEHHRFLSNYVPPFVVEDIFSKMPDRVVFNCANFSDGYLLILAVENFSLDEQQTIIRFAKVFEQTYTRFLDLQKAEAQAREAQIELGLERVRARAMAMQTSDELSELVDTVFKELTKLDMALNWCIINIIDAPSLSNMVWAANPDTNKAPDSYLMKFEDYPFHDAMMKGYKGRKEKFVYTIEGKEKKEYDNYLFSETEFRKVPKEAQATSKAMKKYVCSFTFSNFGGLQTVGEEPLSEENLDILARFGKVFDLTYTRFNDLLKAEAQTREAQIEVAVERVRAKALAMHQSGDLYNVVETLKREIIGLKIPGVMASTIYLRQDDGSIRIVDLSAPDEDGDEEHKLKLNKVFRIEDTDPKLWVRRIWEGTENYFVVEADEADFTRVVAWLRTIDMGGAAIAEKIIRENSIKKAWLPTVKLEKGKMNIDLLHPPTAEIETILLKMGAGFDLAYTRFLDLQKAEAQAREAQIELGLERVRARAMAMQTSDELSDLVDTVFSELTKLDFALSWCMINIIDEPSLTNTLWSANPDIDEASKSIQMKFEDYPFHHASLKAYRERQTKFVYMMEGVEKKEYEKYMFTKSEVGKLPAAAKKAMRAMKRYVFTYSFSNFGGLQTVGEESLSEDNLDILARFGKVFDLTYTRFNDLLKAEAQAREAEIELALERVRARTMAMQKSDELKEVIQVVYDQFVQLNINIEHTGFILDYKERDDMLIWLADKHGVPSPQISIPYFDSPHWNSFIEAKKKKKPFFANQLDFKTKNKFYKQLFNLIPGIPKETIDFYQRCPGLAISTVLLDNVGLYIENFDGIPYADEENNILMRFGKVFQQTFTRFLDLQKAEKQTREVQIEVSVERVRAQSMAMHSPEDFAKVAEVLWREVNSLNIEGFTGAFILTPDQNDIITAWDFSDPGNMGNPQKNIVRFDANKYPTIGLEGLKKWKEGHDYFILEYDLKKLKAAVKEWRSVNKNIADGLKQAIASGIMKHQWNACGRFSEGILSFDLIAPPGGEVKQILLKMTQAFNLAYGRFLDLQKAEAQARESEIELALERVRARTMAMQHSEELLDVASILFQQVKALGVPQWNCGFNIWEIGDQEFTYYPGTPDGIISPSPCKIPLTEHPVFMRFDESRKKGDKLLVYEKQGEEQEDHYRYMLSLPGVGDLLRSMLDAGFELPAFQIDHVANFSYGNLIFITFEHFPEMHDVFKRFAKVFEQTYTRFLDLQKSEAQARESQIELALERVRARTMAMQRSDELQDTSLILFQQLKELGEPAEQCTIGIIKESEGVVEISATLHGSIMQQTFRHKIDEPFVMNKIFRGWKDQQRTLVLEIKEKELQKYNQYRNELVGKETFPVILLPGDRRIIHAAYFSKGMLALSTNEPRPAESLQLLERFAKVFEQTYTRFLDLQKSEAQARESQIQLALERVRARTMAMQRSEELAATASLLFSQISDLGIQVWSSGFQIWNDDETSTTAWMNSVGGEIQAGLRLPHTEDPYFKNIFEARHNPDGFFVMESKGKELEDTYRYMFNIPEWKKAFGDIEASGFPIPTYQITHCVYFQQGYLMLITYEPYPEFRDILKRFGKVFEQTYTRFLDLQKAEAQAREAQIELGLERVRARAMAMQKSDELKELVSTVSVELGKLDIVLDRCFIVIYDVNTLGSTWWMSNPETPLEPLGLFVKYHEYPPYMAHLKAWREKKVKWQYILEGVTKKEWDKFLFVETELSMLPHFVIDDMRANEKVYLSSSFNNFGYLSLATLQPLSDEQFDILLRFAKVFDLTYTRFNDLQKAEAQAREAQIEAALERVRSRSMAMHKTDELFEAAELIYKELNVLGITSFNASYAFVYEDKKQDEYYGVNPMDGKIFPFPLIFPQSETPVMSSIMLSWKKREPFNLIELDEEGVKKHQTYIGEHILAQFIKNKIDIPFSVEKFVAESPETAVIYSFNYASGYLFIIREKKLTTDEEQTILRFAKVFDQTYTRFLDLQKAEAQAREAQIEAALERVRSKTMAMHKSEELPGAASLLFHQIQILGVPAFAAGYCIWDEDKQAITLWMSSEGVLQPPFKAPTTEDELFIQMRKGYENGRSLHIVEMGGEELVVHYKYMRTLPVVGDIFDALQEAGHPLPLFQVMHYVYFSKGFLLFITYEPVPNVHDIFKRFGKVFEQTYTRFLDLQKAEAQVRESQIEASLERVRSRSMAMHKSDEVMEVAVTLYDEVQKLGFQFGAATIVIMDKATGDMDQWVAGFSQKIYPGSYQIKYFKHPCHDAQLDAWKEGRKYLVYTLTGEERNSYNHHIFNHTDFEKFPESEKTWMMETEPVTFTLAYMKHGALMWAPNAATQEQLDILQRFAKVFEQTYTRFLDLQKAEAQAREAQIEAALERVRSRTMGMQQSTELGDVANELFNQMNLLVTNLWTCGFVLCEKDREEDEWWLSMETGFTRGFMLPNVGDYAHKTLYEGWEKREAFRAVQLDGNDLQEHYKWLMNLPVAKSIFEEMDAAGLERPDWQKLHAAYFSKGYLVLITREPCGEEEIFKRFAQVFDQTYTRFLDLKKAEAQAREAQIEAALEKVRSRSLAMQKTEELQEVVAVVAEKLKELGVILDANGVIICTYFSNSKDVMHWMAVPDFSSSGSYLLPYFDHPIFNAAWESKINGDDYFSKSFTKEEKDSFFQYAFAHSDYRNFPDDFKQWIFQNDKHSLSFAWAKNSALLIPSHTGIVPNENDKEILKRFVRVFEQAYIRFMDLQNAEILAHKSKIEVALERVRARALAMQEPEELKEVAQVLRTEMGLLGVEELETCSIYINDEQTEKAECWYALKDLRSEEKKLVNDYFALDLNDTWVGREMLQFYHSSEKQTSIVMTGDNRVEWIRMCEEKSSSFRGYYGEVIPDRTYHLYKFSHGAIGAAAAGDISKESWELLRRAASVFSLAYSRFKDLTQARIDLEKLKTEKQRAEDALTNLKAAQSQLVQSEKMASLGELTAGIAHEIQNPLNFVNNFSEVSKELLDEMKEAIEKGEAEEVMEIMNDVIQNLEKINHHGKRADSIVKGMLQHSRSSSGTKEPTDINALADEYLRLAYHGLRAKDKSFNATMKTEYEDGLEKINVIPQDIGRVVLNLITNAFYVVSEKARSAVITQTAVKYEPTVSISTKKVGDKVEVSVKDNGNGIPQKVMDKIFQPFFTTKPTGQGTGLGLSLAFDIVKTHGGELKVETKEGDGSEFIISLPY